MRGVALAATALVGGLALAPMLTGTAQAAPSGTCPEGYVCFWSGENFTGTMKIYENPVNHTCSATSVEPARSVYNNDDQTWTFYASDDCSGSPVDTLIPNSAIAHTKVNSWS